MSEAFRRHVVPTLRLLAMMIKGGTHVSEPPIEGLNKMVDIIQREAGGVEIRRRISATEWQGAWLLDDGRVLKITDDIDEAITSAAIQGADFDHVVKIYDVFHFGNKIFIIIAEYGGRSLEIADRDRANKLDELDLSDELEATRRTVGNQMDAWIETLEQQDDAIFQQIADGLKELKQRNVYFTDVHSGNIVIGPGGVKIIDLGGRSKAPPGGRKPRKPTIEQAIDSLRIRSVNESIQLD